MVASLYSYLLYSYLLYFYVKMEKIHIFLLIYNKKEQKFMITKTKLTVTINKELLNLFNEMCDDKSINKSKLVATMIKKWCQEKNNDNKNVIG